MRAVVLLSAGLHPVSGAPVAPRVEAQATRLGAGLGDAVGLHVGPDTDAAAEALGRGLGIIEHLLLPAAVDPAPALVAALREMAPDVILAGRRGQGGEDSGLLPYALARALNLPLIPDVSAARPGAAPGTLEVDQALPKGALRRLTVRTPVVLTVHPSAPDPRVYAYGQARRGRIIARAWTPSADVAPAPAFSCEEKPYRPRPKLMRGAPAGGSAADRLKAATGGAESAGGHVLVASPPEVAAREIIAYLRRVGVMAPAPERAQEKTT